MRITLAGLLLSTSLVAPAMAATVTQNVTIGPASAGTYNGMFDFSSLIASELSNGYNVVFTSGAFSFTGSSNRVADPYYRRFSHRDSSRSCSGWSCSTHYWDQYYSYSGDRSTDSVHLTINGSQNISDDTYNGYGESTDYFASINGNHAHVTHRTYSSYGHVSATGALSVANLGLLNSSSDIAYRFSLYGDPFTSLTGSMTLSYNRVAAVPLPASAMMLITGFGGFGLISASRRKRKKKLPASPL